MHYLSTLKNIQEYKIHDYNRTLMQYNITGRHALITPSMNLETCQMSFIGPKLYNLLLLQKEEITFCGRNMDIGELHWNKQQIIPMIIE